MNRVFRSILVGITGICLMLLLGTLPAYAQRPQIQSFEPTQASFGHKVTIKGNSFGTAVGNLIVMFGAAKADIVSVTDQLIEVTVPAGATHDNIAVTNISAGLTGYSREQFFINFHGDGTGFSLTNLQGQFDFPTGTPVSMEGLFDLCMCDFNGDGLNDVATAKTGLQAIEYYTNVSTPGNVAFNKSSTTSGSTLRYVQCGDITGDGKPDLVASDATPTGGRIFVFKNTSAGATVSFALQPSIPVSGHTPKRIEIADLDLDGKADLVLSDESIPGSVIIVKNQSTTTSILFATPIYLTLPNTPTAGSNALAVQDLDGDDLPEIVVSPFNNSENSVIFIIKNKSRAGTFVLTDITQIDAMSVINNIRIGDLDGDGKPDLACAQLIPQKTVGVFLNRSTSSTITFSNNNQIVLAGNVQPFGLDLGDMDGDGKIDIVTASNLTKAVAILRNQSSTGSVSFAETTKTPTNWFSRHVTVGDVDGDGKPDIAFTSVDNVQLNEKASKVSILRNTVCMKPIIEPAGPISVCANNTDPIILTATRGGGVTYEWTNTTTNTPYSDDYTFTPTTDGSYVVKAVSADCATPPVSNVVVFNKSSSGTLNGSTTAGSNSPACVGSPLTLTTTDQGAGFTYTWTGPSGFTASTREPQIPSATLQNAGVYTVEIHAPSGCLLKTLSTPPATVITPPTFVIAGAPAPAVGCGLTAPLATLSVSPQSSDYDYFWYRNGVQEGAASTTYAFNQPGEYYYIARSNKSCANAESDHYTYRLLAEPHAEFSMPASACQGEEVQMNNISTWDNTEAPEFKWYVGTSATPQSTIESPVLSFTNATTYNVKLTVSYGNGTCARDYVQSIAIVGTGLAPLTITNPNNTYEICKEGTLLLQATAGFSAYEWNVDGETGASLTAEAAGEYTVRATAPSGCVVTVRKTITEIEGPQIVVSADPPVIDEGEQTKLSVTNLLDYSWEPAETVSDPSIAQPTATPLVSTSYSVSGKDVTGCVRHATVLVEVHGNAIVTKLFPGNFFSPNGDDQNPYWMVGQIDQYPQCGVVIYDDKGVKVFDSKPYQNNWDGTFNGKKLPDGVYYYVIRCDGEESKPRMGAITILR